jgi:hypothetical protein
MISSLWIAKTGLDAQQTNMIQQLKSMGEKVSKAYSTDLENLF